MSYFTIINQGTSEFEEKKSRFIGNVMRVESEDEAKKYIEEIKNRYKDARHNVFAYIVGENMGIQRYSDDGEPKGTGGIPVLEVLKRNNLTDVVVVVTRYFGGVLLGASNLTRAYSNGASLALKATEIVEKVRGFTVRMEFDYDLLGKIQYTFEKNQWHIEDTAYTDKVAITVNIEKHSRADLENTVKDLTMGKVTIEIDEEQYFFKMGYRLYA
ncbi:uncharacterized protein, YigZ family [Hathewaya proteolytica DSM 3090]|uniref:Uncharacterized protein, YigZ family n=1 Tax=Hathewaya proteolytica DSM 3090 TaxID=1121331 RepID=A0A1M6P979_9CLOT|nr:YigZ family protein [Hathewaya proteolytica]SHK04503.1 uncharacterized protein, YigZ family [Hathewaya proteolytica DSM 3090]